MLASSRQRRSDGGAGGSDWESLKRSGSQGKYPRCALSVSLTHHLNRTPYASGGRHSLQPSRPVLGPTQIPVKSLAGLIPGGINGQGVAMTIHPQSSAEVKERVQLYLDPCLCLRGRHHKGRILALQFTVKRNGKNAFEIKYGQFSLQIL